MHSPEQLSPQEFSHVSDLLLHIAKEAERLDMESERKLYQDNDSAGFEADVRARALLVKSLPDSLAVYKSSGGDVPEDVERIGADWGDHAGRFLRSDNMFGMMMLLKHRSGYHAGEPSELELLARQCQPV